MQSVWQVLLELAPWLLLGSLAAGIMHVLLPADFLRKQLQGSIGLLKAIAIGIPLPLCSCAVIPVGLSIKQSGASRGATVGFLISTPQTGIDSILVSASFLGWPFALLKVLSAAAMGLIGGWWTDREPPELILPVITNADSAVGATQNRWMVVLLHSLELLRSIWRWLLFGVLVSAAITTWLPPDAFAMLSTTNQLAPMLVALIVALPLYICATASVPIAAALVSGGFPVGAALVLLMAGPATNVATIGAVYRALGRRALAIYLSTVIVGSILCGLLFGFVLDTPATALDHSHHATNWWSTLSAVALTILLAAFAWQETKQVFAAGNPAASKESPSHDSCCK